MGPERPSDDDPKTGTVHVNEHPLWQGQQVDTPQPSTPGSSDLHVQSDSELENHHLQLPVWLRESSKSFRWRWVPVRVRQWARAVAKWSKGPVPPKIQKISPWFAPVQEAIPNFISRQFPKRRQKVAVLAFFYFCWFLTFTLILHHSAKAGSIEGYGKPQSIWCGASFWEQDNDCGLNGDRCRPFDNATFAFRCPANCRETTLQNPRAVGDQEIAFQNFVIGGPRPAEENSTAPETVYRGDSFICHAAIHSGLVGNDKGGCGVARLVGEQQEFHSTRRHNIQSIAFDSTFPKSFTFVKGLSSSCVRDLRWPLLAVTCAFTTILSLSCTTPWVLFPSVFTMLFFHVGLVSDPPTNSDYPTLTSIVIGRFLPGAFVAYVLYHVAIKQQHTGLTATIERTILWLGGAWVGSLNNYTFIYIPIHRLTPSDIKAQPGAVLALVIIVLTIFTIALGQAWYLRQEGRFRKYLAIYALMGGGLIICTIIPQLNLRIHHYFLAILLLPGTRLQTRPSLLYQGILVGLFVNGVARWGFDSIMQTSVELRGDGLIGSALPNITWPILASSNITFGWDLPPPPYDGLSVLVNDVERHRWYWGEGVPEVTFDRHVEGVREYFRFGYLQGSDSADFTKAGVWTAEGDWLPMDPGPG